jgi:hypothetical protein
MKYLKNRYVQLGLVLVLGLFLGNLLKDHKVTEIETLYKKKSELERKKFREDLAKKQEEVEASEKNYTEYKEETNTKLESLRTENYTLRQKVKKRKYKLVKPDGTIIEKEYEESDTTENSTIITSIKQEFTRKVSSIEKKWKKVHIKRLTEVKKKYTEIIKKKDEEIETLKKKEVVNPKKFRPEVGITTDKHGYIHTTYPIWGPLIIGGGATLNKEYSGNLHLGIGLEW